MGKRSLQSAQEIMDFSVTEYKSFIDIVSDFTLQLTFKSTPLVKFWCSIKKYPQLPEKAIKTFFPSQLHMNAVCMRLAFSHILQLKITYYGLNAEAEYKHTFFLYQDRH